MKRKISTKLWAQLIEQLCRRGKNERETGAFLLGPFGTGDITEFICYNDLDAEAFDSGIIIFKSEGYMPLWKHCLEEALTVLADVHTHPGNWSGQSTADQTHPMISQRGHIALIVPNYATREQQTLRNVGVYEYQGDLKWKIIKKKSNSFQILK